MNERIKELALQAGLKQRIWNSLGKELPMWQEDPDNPGLEKFAELIVLECIGICEKDGQWYTNTGWLAEAGEAMSLSDQIKKHFGVK